MSRSYEFGIICKNCGTLFDASREDAKYCGVKCRLAVSQRKAKNEKKLKRYKETVTEMSQMWRDFSPQETFDFLSEAVALLTKARNAVTND